MATSASPIRRSERKRPGRPASSLKKVTITIRIPEDVDSYLNTYSYEHNRFKGDIITEALLSKFPALGSQYRTASL